MKYGSSFGLSRPRASPRSGRLEAHGRPAEDQHQGGSREQKATNHEAEEIPVANQAT